MSPERASLFEGVQIGKETVPGTAVAATKKLLSTSFEFGAAVDVTTFRPNGFKYPTIASLNTEWVEGSISGQLAYTDIVYLLSSLISVDTPATTGTTGYEWVFVSDSDGPDAPATFTVEQGSSVRAHRFANMLVSALTMTFDTDGTEIDGEIIGTALEDGVTMTATPTEIALVPVMRTQVAVYIADTAAGLDAAPALSRIMSIEWALSDRYQPVVTLNQSPHWDAYIESEPTGEVTFTLAADADGMTMLDAMRIGQTKFIRIEAVGPVIGAGPAVNTLTIDTAVKISDMSDFQDEDGLFAVEWTGTITHDSTWGKAFQISVINGLSAL